MAKDEDLLALRNRYTKSWDKANEKQLAGLADLSLEEAFRLELRKQPGEPTDQFTDALVPLLPPDREKATGFNFADAFDKALANQLNGLKDKMNAVFDEALGKPTDRSVDKPPSLEGRKQAVARLMFGMSPYLAEEQLSKEGAPEADKKLVEGLKTSSVDYWAKLPETDAFRKLVVRVYLVNGVADALATITERTLVLGNLSRSLKDEMVTERSRFVTDHEHELNRLRVLAAAVAAEKLRVDESQRQLDASKVRVKERQEDVTEVSEKLTKERAKAASLAEALQQSSQKVLEARLKVADIIRKTEEREARLRYLEKLARDVENKGR